MLICQANCQKVLIGISRPLNFQLPISHTAPVVMIAGGSGIAPFRGFWRSRVHGGGTGRNILFLGVQTRKKFLYESEIRKLVRNGTLEAHIAFSRDSNGLVYDRQRRDLVEKQIKPRYIDAAILDQASDVCDVIMSTKQGGLGGYLYVCGSVSLYETVAQALLSALYRHRAVTKEGAESLLATAFAERRLMLDIFMTPRSMSNSEPVISISKLAHQTGHRENTRMWIGVHGCVYDITDFLPIHPGGTLIVAASAGLDATRTFEHVAHTNNPEVASLLSKYFIGYLAPKPEFFSRELNDLRDTWLDYLQAAVENLTTLSFEIKSLMEGQGSQIWFSGGLLNMGGVRKFYQFQSRLLQNAFPKLFGPMYGHQTKFANFQVSTTLPQAQLSSPRFFEREHAGRGGLGWARRSIPRRNESYERNCQYRGFCLQQWRCTDVRTRPPKICASSYGTRCAIS